MYQFNQPAAVDWGAMGATRVPGSHEQACIDSGGHWDSASLSCDQSGDGERFGTLRVVMEVAGTVGAFAGAYHGYKRNGGSVGWAIGWFIFGGLLPIIALPVMLVEGFGDKK
jgi:hypothetical protein